MKKAIRYMAFAALSFAAAISAPSAWGACETGALAGVKAQNVKVHRAKGGLMRLQMDIDLSQLKLSSNGRLTLRPAIYAGSDTARFRPVVIYGRNQLLKLDRGVGMRLDDATEIKYEKGKQQTVSYSETVPYADWMEYCDVSLFEDECGCGRFKDSAMMPLASIDNRRPGDAVVCYITPKAEAEKNRDESGQAFLDFIVNKTNIEPNYRNNRVELAKIINTINLVKDDPFVTITNINIHGFASPEGTYANNTRLATGRAAALKDYVKSLYDLPDHIFTSNATPEDWENLRIMVDKSDLKEREQILSIIDSNMDYDAKDHEIKRQFPQTYAFILRDWYPALRHSDYKVSYVVRPLTIEEAKEVLKTNPKNLSLNEMFLVAQTYEPGSPEFNNVFEVAAKVFPTDPTANLNAACTVLNNNDLAAAEAYLAKAGNSPEAIHARGILAMKKGNYDVARSLLNQARDAGVEQAKSNLEILERLVTIAKAQEEL